MERMVKMSRISLLSIFTAILLFISFSVVHAETSELYFDYLKSVFNKHDKKLSEFLQAELDAYLSMYPDNQYSPEASCLLGQVYNERGKEHMAFAMFIKTILLYPDSEARALADTEIRRIIANNKVYQEKPDEISRAIDGAGTGIDFTDRHFEYLTFLRELNVNKLYEWTIQEFYNFLIHHRDDERCEKIHRWIADYYNLKGDPEASVAGYLKYEKLYADNPNLAYVKVNRADVMYKELKDFESANAVLTEVIENYPATEHAALALFLRAEIKDRRLKNPNGAIEDYRRLVTEMPAHDKAVEALMAIADINAGELKAYRAAINTYDEIAEDYPADKRGVDALREAAELHMKLKEAHNAAKKYAQIAVQFPDYEKSPEMLFKAADIAAGKLKDYPGAIEYFEMVVAQYPDTEMARKARKKIEKLQEKVGE